MLQVKLLNIGFRVRFFRNETIKLFIDSSNPDQGLIITYPSVLVEGKVNNTYDFSINLTCQMNNTDTANTKFHMLTQHSDGRSEKFTLISMQAYSRYGNYIYFT